MEEQPAVEAAPAPEQAEFKQEAPAAADGAPGEGGERTGRPPAAPAWARRLPPDSAGRAAPRAHRPLDGPPGLIARPPALQAPAAGASPPATAAREHDVGSPPAALPLPQTSPPPRLLRSLSRPQRSPRRR